MRTIDGRNVEEISLKIDVADLLLKANGSIYLLSFGGDGVGKRKTDDYEAIQLTEMKAMLKNWDARKGEWKS